jgi:hypothetical protein
MMSYLSQVKDIDPPFVVTMAKPALDSFGVLAADIEDNLGTIGNVIERREVEVVMLSLEMQPLLV